MANKLGTFFDPISGKRKAYAFGTQPKEWQLETPDNQYQPDRALALEGQVSKEQAGYDTERKALEERLLGQLDLPTLFESAAKQANPNYGLSRPEILARFNDPKYSDTKSSTYVDPFTRTAIADRMKTGYQGVISDAADRASAILGKDVTARQFALDKAAENLKGTQGLLSDEMKSREDLAKEDRDYAREIALLGIKDSLSGTGTGSGLGSSNSDSTAANYAQQIANGQMTITNVPIKDRASVVDYITNNKVDILPQTARNSISAVNAARGVLEQIKAYSGGVNKSGGLASKLTGGLAALGGKFQWGGDAANSSAALGDISKALVSTLSRGLGEKGVLTDYDVKRAKALIPTPFDSKDAANRKITQLENFFKNIEERAYAVATGTPSSLGLKNDQMMTPANGKTSSGLGYTIIQTP